MVKNGFIQRMSAFLLAGCFLLSAWPVEAAKRKRISDSETAPESSEAPETLFLVKQNGRYGFMNSTGKLVIPCQYELANPFSDGMAVVMAAGGWSYIDPKGRMLLRPQFLEARDFSEGYAAVKVEGKYGYINKKGYVVIKPQFDRAEKFSEGLAAVMVGDRWGYIDQLGHFVVKPRFFRASDFADGLAVVMMFSPGDTSQRSDEALLGYIDKKGNYVWEPTR